MKLSLHVLTAGKQEGKVLPINSPQFLVGRDPQCQLRPSSALISKRHCAILQRDGKAYIRDFGSTNGTYVNDERVEGEQELSNDDQLKIGPIEFTVRIEAKGAGSPTPAPPTKSAPAAAAKPNDTPAPATSPKKPEAVKSGKGDSAEDDIAAMLMSLDDDSSSGAGGDMVPDGSTVFDLKVPPEVGAAAAAATAKDAKKPAGSGDTRSAAAKILEEMTRRPRKPS